MKRKVFHNTKNEFIGVGISSSGIGGVDALIHFFDDHLEKAPFSFFVVNPLEPGKADFLVDLLQMQTKLPVSLVQKEKTIEPNKIYLLHPEIIYKVDGDNIILGTDQANGDREYAGGRLFEMLAKSMGEYSVGVALSGTGKNEIEKLSIIKDNGGNIFVQDPEEAAKGSELWHAVDINLTKEVHTLRKLRRKLLKLSGQILESEVRAETELLKSNEALESFVHSIEVETLIVDNEGHVQYFVSGPGDIFELSPSDIGRPLNEISNQLINNNELLDDVQKVLNEKKSCTREVVTKRQQWFKMHISPYNLQEDDIEGIVISFIEITSIKKAKQEFKNHVFQEEKVAKLGLDLLDEVDFSQVIEKAIQTTCSILDVGYTLLLKINSEDNTFELVGGRSCFSNWSEKEAITQGKMSTGKEWEIGHVFSTGEPLAISDYRKEKRFKKVPLLRDENVKSGLCVRVDGSEGAYGVLGVYAVKPKEFSKREVHLLKIIAHMVGETIERHQTKKRLSKANEELKEQLRHIRSLQKDILKASVDERWQIGQYLHDDLAQQLIAIQMIAQNIKQHLSDHPKLEKEMQALIDTIKEAGVGVRNLSHEVMPIDVEEKGLEYALKLMTKNINKLYSTNCSIETSDVIEQIDDVDVATNIYHIAQEASKNAALHGNAENIIISLEQDEDSIVLKIIDDGIGFSEARKKKSKHNGGMGINIMKHRTDLLKGDFEIKDRSGEDNGTIVTCRLPFSKDKNADTSSPNPGRIKHSNVS